MDVILSKAKNLVLDFTLLLCRLRAEFFAFTEIRIEAKNYKVI